MAFPRHNSLKKAYEGILIKHVIFVSKSHIPKGGEGRGGDEQKKGAVKWWEAGD